MSLKIVLGGPPQSGKSCLRDGLIDAVRGRGSYIYFITANPDGEGAWFNKSYATDPTRAKKYKQRYKSDYSAARIQKYCDDVRRCREPLVGIDIGGKPTPDNYLICRNATHAVLLAVLTWRSLVATFVNRLANVELQVQERKRAETAHPSRWLLLRKATAMALECHEQQTRKGTGAPYISHLFAVTSLVLEYGGDDAMAAAAMLHDAAEDQGGDEMLEQIERELGSNTAHIVRECSDSLSIPKRPWRERKELAIAAVPKMSSEGCLVKAADAFHNVTSLTRDYQRDGDRIWDRFRGGRAGTLWFYSSISEALYGRVPDSLATQLRDACRSLNAIADVGD